MSVWLFDREPLEEDDRVLFVDDSGKTWNKTNIEELIEADRKFKNFLDCLNHYF